MTTALGPPLLQTSTVLQDHNGSTVCRELFARLLSGGQKMKLDEFLSRLAAEPTTAHTPFTYVYFVEPTNVVAPILKIAPVGDRAGNDKSKVAPLPQIATTSSVLNQPHHAIVDSSRDVASFAGSDLPDSSVHEPLDHPETGRCCRDSLRVDSIRPGDIIGGRSRQAWNHDGNQRFRAIINDNVKRYMDASSSQEKTIITESVVDELLYQGRCRFVKTRNEVVASSTLSTFVLLNKREIREKVSHALRDLAKSHRRHSRTTKTKQNGNFGLQRCKHN